MNSTPSRAKANAQNPQAEKKNPVPVVALAMEIPPFTIHDALDVGTFDGFTNDLRRLYHSRYGALAVYLLKSFVRSLDAEPKGGA